MIYTRNRELGWSISNASILDDAKSMFPNIFAGVQLSQQTVALMINEVIKQNFISSSQQPTVLSRKRGPQPHPRPVGHIDDEITPRWVSHALKQKACDIIVCQVEAHVPISVPLASRLFNAVFQANGVLWQPERSWVLTTLHEIGLSPRKVTQCARHLPRNFEQLGKAFVLRIADIVQMFGISDEFILNFDETGLLLFHINNQTWGKKGAKQVPGRAKEEKRQRTVIPCITAAGVVAQCMVVWGGKTSQCLPAPELCQGYPVITHNFSESHWSTPKVILDYFISLYERYFVPQCIKMGKHPPDTYCLVIMDVYSSHIDKPLLEFLKVKLPTFIILFVPAACTPKLAPCDIEFNFWFKRHIAGSVRLYLQNSVVHQLAAGKSPDEIVIDTNLSAIKEVFIGSISSAVVNTPTDVLLRSFAKCGVEGTEFLFANIRSPKMLQHLKENPNEHWLALDVGNSKGRSRYSEVIGNGGAGVMDDVYQNRLSVPANMIVDKQLEAAADFALVEDDFNDGVAEE